MIGLVLMTIGAIAQSMVTGTVEGSVSDASGAGVPTATVKLCSAATGAAHDSKAGPEGNYRFDPVKAGLNTGVTEDSLRGSPYIRIGNFNGASATQPLGRIDTTSHITENLSISMGKHQIKVGGEYRRAVLDVFYDTNKKGTFSFDGTRGLWATDSSVSPALRSLSDFLAGQPTNNNGASIVRGQLRRYYLQNSFDWWAHDNFQVNRKLNINLGVRYTYHGPLYDDRNSITNFLPGKGLDSLYPRDWNNFAPRFGFAYTPTVRGKTVVRGSYGIFYDSPPLNFIVANAGVPNGGSAGVHADPGGLALPSHQRSVNPDFSF